MGTPDKRFLLETLSGQPAVQSDDKNCIMELFIAFNGKGRILERGEDGRYHQLPLLEMEGSKCRLSS